MKSLLFVIAAAPLLVSPALARGDSPAESVQNRTCKWCGSDPSYYGTQARDVRLERMLEDELDQSSQGIDRGLMAEQSSPRSGPP